MPEASDAHIVVIEDDPEFGEFLEMLLEDVSDNVSLIESGIEGLKVCLSEKPDLVVLDLNLPGLRGEEILRLLRSSSDHASVRVLICSEMPREQRREMELLNWGADSYIEKPFMEEAFLGDVRALLDAPPRGEKPAPFRAPLSAPPQPPSPPGPRLPLPPVDSSEQELSLPPPRTAPSFEESTLRREPSSAFRAVAPTEEEEKLGEELDDRLFPDYELLGVIGAGNMGTVYKARQISTGRVAAVKVLLRSRADTPEAIARFQREAQIMARVDHPNALKVYDAGSTGFTFYIAMEYVDGCPLDELMGALDWPQWGHAIAQACDAIIHLHDRDIIHRDIKPANILIARGGAVKLGDFGISRAHLPGDQAKFTQVAGLMGTPLFMAPELMMGSPANAQSDQFALGRTVLRMFEGPNFQMPPPDIDKLRPDLPASLRAAVKRTLDMYPHQRFPTMREAKEALLADWDPAAAPWPPPLPIAPPDFDTENDDED